MLEQLLRQPLVKRELAAYARVQKVRVPVAVDI